MTDPYIEDYIRLIERARKASFLPWPVKARLGRWLGRRTSFLHHRRERIVDNMCACLGISSQEAEGHFVHLCENTGMAMQMVFQLPRLGNPWIERHVETGDTALLQTIREEGGVILSHHSFHHNLLASSLKRWGLVTFAVANPPQAFSADDYLYRFTLRLNADTEANLNGGRFLFVDGGKDFVFSVNQALQNRQALLVFCDFNEAKPFNKTFPFLTRSLQPPSGLIRLLGKREVPFYFAGFGWHPDGKYRLQLRELSGDIMASYLAALEDQIRNQPYMWQGWDSF